jgi:hypothetical protein
MTLIKRLFPGLIFALMLVSTATAGIPVPVEPDDSTSVYPEFTRTSRKADTSSLLPAIPLGASPLQDRYGYSYNDSLSPAWMDLTAGGVEVDFSTRDDDSFGPVPIGFGFNFYENTYSELYIGTNGLITFGEGSDQFVNFPPPRDTEPDNYIAPFWDDLIMLVDTNGQRISKVFYKAGSDAGGLYLAVEWFQIARLGSQDLLTFEVILRPDSSILFQYHDLNGVIDQATVGIEDEHGVDGLLYLHNAPGLSTSKAILISRPGAGYRSKVYPVYRSAFAERLEATLNFTVRNSGNSGADVYDLILSSIPSGWQVRFYAANGKTPLSDTDGDQIIDTGSVASHADFGVRLKITAPSNAVVGDYIHFNATAASSQAPSKTATINLQVAVPAPFAQASFDPWEGPNLKLLWKENRYGTNLNQGRQFTGSNLSVLALPDKRFIYTWEYNWRNDELGFTYTNLEYTMLSRFGTILIPTAELTNNDNAEVKTEDRFLSLAGAQDGRIGAIWVRSQGKEFEEDGNIVPRSNYNVYFAVLDSNGSILVQPVNLTQNDLWRGQDDFDVPVFIAPRVVATTDNRFFLAWGDERNHEAGSSADLFYAIMDTQGNVLVSPSALTESVPGEARFTIPGLVALNGNRVVIAYVLINPGAPDDPDDDIVTTVYSALNSAGSVLKAQTSIPGSGGSTPDGIQYPSGGVLLAWSVPNARLEYVVLDGTSLNISAGGLHSLAEPKGREAGAVSVSSDGAGHAVLSWGDREQSDYLCYSLLGDQGEMITPPMIFLTGMSDEPLINTNSFGFGNAPYDGSWRALLPSINNH